MNRTLLWIPLVLVGCGPAAPAPARPAPEPATADVREPTPEAPPAPAPAAQSLYERLGGQPAITAVVDEFVTRTTTDPRIKYRFFNTDPDNLKKLLVEFVCAATGGPCTYTGRDMTSAHAGMDLVDDEFTALVEDLVGALDKFKVPEREKGELLGALGPLKPQIVVDASRLRPVPKEKLAKASALLATVKDEEAAGLLGAAITAAERGQRSFAEQLFSRAEMIVGEGTLASAAPAFREGAPPRIDAPLTSIPDTAPQPKTSVGTSEDERTPPKKVERSQLRGVLQLDGKRLDGVGVVMLWPTKGGGVKRVARRHVMEQRDKAFAPHMMAVAVGSTVAFPNYDAVFHNVFSLSPSMRFDLGLYRGGSAREMTFTKPGIFRLGCNIHANMSAYLVVVDAPHYVVADADGTFAFKRLKPGKYKVRAWAERSAAPTATEVTLEAGANELTIDLAGGAKEGPSEDKFGVPRAP